ncbi:vitamin B12 transporter [Roseateles sp. YR242]|uniref:TonB-dependent receptor plug domain-containing protein n=1 Tax=Roseateles sp. YR242 TaxID=1855305 RepID=UPI0008D59AD7|nr:TonB-dependent receptor [Roseateles sp. YR242]SEL70665.1 vitamin B12 transporter [Roseateles sp. YR242]
MSRSLLRARPCARSLLALTPPGLTPLLLAAWTLASPALAQGTEAAAASKLDQVTVTGARAPMRLADVLGDLTLITRDDIEKQGYGNLADLLRNVGGLEITRNGTAGATTSVYVRGAESRHTVVLVDGVRIDSQSTGGADWQNIPLSQIDRVEVLKGPASALYGSDAIGGVVQIFTRRGNGRTQVELGIGAGNLGTGRADASITGGSRQFDYAATLAVDRGTGFNSYLRTGTGSSNPDKDGWRNYSGSVRLGGQITDGHRLEAVAFKSRTDSGYDASTTADDRNITTTEAGRLGWNGQWSDAFSTALNITESRSEMQTRPTSLYLTRTRLRSATLQGFYKLDDHQQVNALLEHREDQLINSSLVTQGKDDRSQNAVGLSYLLTAGAASLQVHGRHDDDPQFGGVNTGTVAAGYQLGGGWRATASAGNAFRAPTLYQRGSIYGPDLSLPGVEALRPERAHSTELGLNWTRSTYELGVTTYRNQVRDLIAFGAAGTCPSTTGCYGNIARATLKGTSLKAGAQLGWVHLSGQLDFSAPTDDSTGNTLIRRARRYGSLRADTQWSAWTFGATLQGSGARWNDAANKTRLGGYGLVNLDAQYRLAKDWRVQLNIDNALDRTYQTATYYAQAPRTWMLTLRYAPSF